MLQLNKNLQKIVPVKTFSIMRTLLARIRYLGFLILIILYPFTLFAQKQDNVFSDSASIDECISYAMKYQPLVRQLKLDEAIANQNIKISLSDWLPQISTSAEYSYYIKRCCEGI